jgi:peptidoglycan hydrolase-like protein with peptidoglycan-binding domain
MPQGTLSPWPISGKGDQQHPVQTLQNLLRARGHTVAVDGIFGPKTDAAVRGFQQALHQDIPSVAVDGIVGPVTWQALVSGMLSF